MRGTKRRKRRLSLEKDAIKIFWKNVDWHRKNKNISWSAFYSGADGVKKMKNHELNVTLKKIQEIADKLDIDDYTILFERGYD